MLGSLEDEVTLLLGKAGAPGPWDAPGVPSCLAMRQIFLLVVVLDCLVFVIVLSKTLANYWERGNTCSVSLCLHC